MGSKLCYGHQPQPGLLRVSCHLVCPCRWQERTAVSGAHHLLLNVPPPAWLCLAKHSNLFPALPIQVIEEVFENQRLQPFRGWGHSWPGHFLPTDKASAHGSTAACSACLPAWLLRLECRASHLQFPHVALRCN